MATRRRRRYLQGRRLLCLLTFILSPYTLSAQAESLTDVLFSPYANFTQCSDANTFNVSTVSRTYDIATNTYNLSIEAMTGISVTELNPELTVYSTARTEIMFGFHTIHNDLDALCPDIVSGCPVNESQTVLLKKSIVLQGTALPFADITARYSAYPSTGNGSAWACVSFAPIGYLNPVWQKVFLYLSISFTIFAALVSLISCFATVSNTDHDLLLLTSNYCMLPAALRLRTPGFFDIIYYCQFVVITGQLTLDYPKFYPLFTSIFSWSFLLVPADWIQHHIVDAIFSSWSPSSDEHEGVNVLGTGMSVFSQAVNISVNGFFITALLYFVMIVAAATFLCGMLWAGVIMLSRISPFRFGGQSYKVGNFTVGIILRIMTLFYLPLMIVSFYQLMLPAPWYVLLLAALVLVFHIFLVYGFISFQLLRVRPPSLIFSDVTLLLRYGSLYNTLTDDTFSFFVVSLFYHVLVGIMVAGFQSNGTVQLAVILVAEVGYLTSQIVRWPHASYRVNVQYTALSVARVIGTCLNIPYVASLAVLDRNKQVVGYAQVALHCAVFLTLFAFPIRNLAVLLTGVGGDELYESGQPPARMTLWRRTKKQFSSERRGRGRRKCSAMGRSMPTSWSAQPMISSQAMTSDEEEAEEHGYRHHQHRRSRNSTTLLTYSHSTLMAEFGDEERNQRPIGPAAVAAPSQRNHPQGPPPPPPPHRILPSTSAHDTTVREPLLGPAPHTHL